MTDPLADLPSTTPHTDVKPGGWIEDVLPPVARSYARLMRLDRPIGSWLLFLPALWAIALASPHVGTGEVTGTILLFGVGSVLMRGAGCVINDLWDRDIDARVERTRTRPLAAGTLTPRQARTFLAALLVLGFLILLQFNALTILLGIAAMPLVIAYPLMKRVTFWPQAFLGLTFNFGALMAGAALTGEITLASIFLYAAGIFWTLGYDTIYAHQDREEDEMIGVKSTARLLGNRSRLAIVGFYTACVALLLAAGLSVGNSLILTPGLAGIAALFAWQVARLDINDPGVCLTLFRFNRIQGLAIAAVLGAHAALI